MRDYEQTISIAATPQKVFGTLTNAAEFGAWWAPADCSAPDDQLRVTFEGISRPLVLQVKTAALASDPNGSAPRCTSRSARRPTAAAQ